MRTVSIERLDTGEWRIWIRGRGKPSRSERVTIAAELNDLADIIADINIDRYYSTSMDATSYLGGVDYVSNRGTHVAPREP